MQKVAEDIAKNTTHIITNTTTLDHLMEIGKVYGWIFAVVVALLIYTWHQKEKAQDKLELVVTNLIKENDKAHSKVFTEMRDVIIRVSAMEVRHEENTRNGSCDAG